MGFARPLPVFANSDCLRSQRVHTGIEIWEGRRGLPGGTGKWLWGKGEGVRGKRVGNDGKKSKKRVLRFAQNDKVCVWAYSAGLSGLLLYLDTQFCASLNFRRGSSSIAPFLGTRTPRWMAWDENP